MNSDFSKNLVLLRKEKGLSQKKVSEDLSISQALLSHYEKGIRECGLEFVVKTAEYFNVSCDFLLGRTDKREMSRADKSLKTSDSGKSSTPVMINGSVNIVFAILKKINSKSLTRQVTNYLSSAVYTMFRMLYSANEKNPQQIFGIDKDLYTAVTSSQMSMAKAKCRGMLGGATYDDSEHILKENIPTLNRDIIENEYNKNSQALFALIDNTEN